MRQSIKSSAGPIASVVMLLALGARAENLPTADEKKIAELEAIRQAINGAYKDLQGEPAPVEESDRVIYGVDDREDVFEVESEFHRELARSTCLLVSTFELTERPDGDYDLLAFPWTFAFVFDTFQFLPVCPEEPFQGQLQSGFCSGFLVGPDLIATAGHCITLGPGCDGTAFVFGFDQIGPNTPPDLIIPRENVYFCAELVEHRFSFGSDHAIVRLDRPVVDRQPLEVRRFGNLGIGDPLVMIGHPVALPSKIDAGGRCREPRFGLAWFEANVDAFGGNSGSMVANRDTGVVEGILVRGATDFIAQGSCAVSNICSDNGCIITPRWEQISKTEPFADTAIPPLGLFAHPATPVQSVGPVGGPFSNDSRVIALSNSSRAVISYTVQVEVGSEFGLLLNSAAVPVMGSLEAREQDSLVISLDSSVLALEEGSYRGAIVFTDHSSGQQTRVEHELLVGFLGPFVLHDFSMDEDPGWDREGPWAFGAPSGFGGDPNSAFTGQNVFGFNLFGDYSNLLPRLYLTTLPLDLSNRVATTLEFRRWLGIESSFFDDAGLEISTDGVGWSTLWSNSTATIIDTAWSLESFDISAKADGQPSVQLRWYVGPTDFIVVYAGWNIDDVRITGLIPESALNAPPVCESNAPLVLWPPNHQFAQVDLAQVVDITDPDGDEVTVRVTGVAQDESINALGDGATECDAEIDGSIVRVRQERHGSSDGRVYTISFVADDGNGGTCSGTIQIHVPANLGETAIDGGPLVDSMTCQVMADIDGNDMVGFTDITQVLMQWGRAGADDTLNWPDADIDGDGVVAFGDILVVLRSWGMTGDTAEPAVAPTGSGDGPPANQALSP